MCGIAGFLATGAGRHGPELLVAMGNALAHRGPDGSGEWLSPDGRAGLAHRRLAILDLSEGGAQPMVSGDRRFAISFNGEVFNYHEIREELKGRGHAFRSDSDTEVLLAACREWGAEGAASRLIGMFAFALWDDRERRLSLVRDRLGIKPLYLARAPGLVLFASELKGIMACPAFSREVDRAALQHYLSFQYVPAPLAIFRDAEKVLPGRIVTIGADGSRSERRYWSLAECWDPAAGARRTEADLFDELKGLLASSIRYRIISDVPLGAFLSGGVDSSLVVALMQREAHGAGQDLLDRLLRAGIRRIRVRPRGRRPPGNGAPRENLHGCGGPRARPKDSRCVRRAVRRLLVDPDDARLGLYPGARHGQPFGRRRRRAVLRLSPLRLDPVCGVAEKRARGAACPRLPTAWANSDPQRLSRDAGAYARRHYDIRRQIESDRLWLSGSREG